MQREKHLETCLVIASGFMVIWLISGAKWLIWVSLGVSLAGAFVPILAKGIHWVWFKIAEGMGYVMSKVILSIVFFGFLTVVAFFYRMFNKDLLQLRRKKEGSYWTNRDHSYSKKDLEQVW